MAGTATDPVIVHLDGDFAGWHATFRPLTRISARVLIDLESESMAIRLKAYTKMILSVEGWSDLDGAPTSDPLDAPIQALEAAAAKFITVATELPKA
jgi:hypothetical protein